jgi:hypothetical protein
VNDSFINGLNYPSGITADGNGNLFVYDTGPQYFGRIGKYTTAGATVNDSLVVDAGRISCLAYDGNGHVLASRPKNGPYDYTGNAIAEYTTSGELVNPSFITGLNFPMGITFDGNGHLFVENLGSGTVGEYTTSGVTVNASLITGLTTPTAIACDGLGHLFVANGGVSTPYSSSILEYTTAGVRVNSFLISGMLGPVGIVVVPEPSSAIFVMVGATILVCGRIGRRTRI